MKRSIECLPENLSKNGLDGSKDPKDKIMICEMDEIMYYIDWFFSKTDKINMNHSSYGLKHIVERGIGKYVSNGELIAAMILSGYRYKAIDINCVFNVKVRRAKRFNNPFSVRCTPPYI
ncbi:hypothetical protein K8352_14895 [Flavobacteriaceae bacterium F89]|uniref:Uncharacterized protein n=1 Tax=Cerina litoralis TaxID=2874477 RepID=A0AAE3JPE9_9FLAO|nr:hypothetical protein [Cerina litoralis]MCG2462045.1 hypothetical protein [Cerina litoralis]